MFQLYIWVPTKGWKWVRKSSNPKFIKALAENFLPLEVKVVSPKGHDYYAGRMCMPVEGSPMVPNTLEALTKMGELV